MTYAPLPLTLPCRHLTLSAALFLPEAEDPRPCLILCHGAFEYKENFFEMAEGLQQLGVAALALDMPGHGASSGDRFHIHIALWVAAIQAALEVLESRPDIDPRRIGVFGFSSGGTAALEASVMEPRLKALVTLDATVRNYLKFWDTVGFKCLTFIGALKKKLTGKDLHLNILSMLKTAHAAVDPEINRRVLSDPQTIAAYSAFPLPGASQCAFVDTIKRAHRITAPTLVMHGREDQVDSPETARLLHGALTCEKSLEWLSPSGHCGHLDTQKHRVLELTAEWALKHLSTRPNESPQRREGRGGV